MFAKINLGTYVGYGLDRMGRPVHALPVDLFRILAGLLSCAYCAAAFGEVYDISGPGGLVDHRLSLELFPYTKWILLQGEVPTGLLQAVFAGAILVSGILAAGYRPTLCAAVLYVLAVSTYRLNSWYSTSMTLYFSGCSCG